jgi:hypothetical protein
MTDLWQPNTPVSGADSGSKASPEARSGLRPSGYDPGEVVSRELLREILLNMIADAHRFDEDIDGDETGVTVNYHMTVGHSQLEELCNLAGIKTAYGETIGTALDRALSEPVKEWVA